MPRYIVTEYGTAKSLCWSYENEESNFPTLSEVISAAKTEFHGVPFENLKLSAGEDGYYIFLEHGDCLLEILNQGEEAQHEQEKQETINLTDVIGSLHQGRLIEKGGQ